MNRFRPNSNNLATSFTTNLATNLATSFTTSFTTSLNPGSSVFKKQELQLQSETQFPSMQQSSQQPEKQQVQTLDFLQASTKEEETDEDTKKDWVLKPGWIEITKDYIQSRKDKNTTKEEYQKEVQKTLLSMITTWEKYRIDYIDLYGEESYDYYYTSNEMYDDSEWDTE